MAHIHEKIDFTSSVYIVNEDAVFLHFHKKTGRWLPVGGHIELDEDPPTAALREAKEESGLDVELVGALSRSGEDGGHKELLPPRFMNRHLFLPGGIHEHVDNVYFGRASNRAVKPAKGEEETEYRWFTKHDLENPDNDLLPAIRFYAQSALAELGK